MPAARWLLVCLAIPAVCADTVEFNRDIRPILSDKCFACHGPDAATRKSKFRLDQEKSAKDGRLIVPSNPEASELIRRVTSTSKALRMPPAYAGHEPLSVAQIDTLRRWIAAGAPWEAHWSLIPPRQRPVPAGQNPIDYFAQTRLAADSLEPSAPADRPTLIRRASFDLTGLPPTPAEVDAFVNDSAPNAFEKVLDRLLASPRYAERMAYRWMEAARYADTNGYQSDGQRDMWRWRDWVIEAFQNNKPFDQFTIEQIGGDQLPHPTLDQRIATAFHRNHRTTAEGGIVPEEFRLEYVADRVETTSIVWLGMTVGCARCHDHKYDPIPQKDFYRLAAFYNNLPEKGLVYNWGNDEPLIKAPTVPQQRQLAVLDAQLSEAKASWQSLQPEVEKAQAKWQHHLTKSTPQNWAVPNPLVAIDLPGQERVFDDKRFIERPKDTVKLDYLDPFTFAARIKPESPNGAILSAADDYFEGQGHSLYLIEGKLRLHVIFRWTDIGLRIETASPLKLHEWSEVAVTYDGSRYAKGVHMYVDGVEQPLKVLFDELNWPMGFSLPFRIGAGGGLRFTGEIDNVRVYKSALSPQQVSTLALRGQTLNDLARLPERTPAQQAKLDLAFLDQYLPPKLQSAQAAVTDAQQRRDKFYAALPTVMVMQETPQTHRDTFVLKRGAYDSPGEKVTPGVPSSLPGLPKDQPANRLALARWLVSRDNPLTARVIVNRYWEQYFGVGLVKTVDDFGSQGEWPIHRDLLDYLAVQFMDSGWDVKALQKSILMSATYQQSSKTTPALLQRDPENRLLARGPRFRLSAEMIRDQALAVSGLLVENVGGPSVKPYQPAGLWKELAGGKEYQADKGEGLYRRSLYTYWKRTVAPPSMVTFDSPNRETCTVREVRTNTPLQALTLMNDTIYVEAARKLAERVMHDAATPADRIASLYRLVLSRSPQRRERVILLTELDRFRAFYAAHPDDAAAYLAVGDSPRDPRLAPPELAAYSAIASLVLNLDEAVTKE